MNRYSLLLGCAAATTVATNANAATESERPNVVIILMDDMGYSDIGCYGSEIATPNIDALASQGKRFSQFYNSARSCPTRASLITGLFPSQTGIGAMTEDPTTKPGAISNSDMGVSGYKGYLNRNCVTIAEVLKASGYHTYMAGKWHLGISEEHKWPLQRGFDRFYGSFAGAMSYMRPSAPRSVALDNQILPPPTDPDYYTTDEFTSYAIKFVEEQKDDDPFFLYLAYNAPHWPLQAKDEDIAKFVELYRENGWQKIRNARLERMKQMGLLADDAELAEWESRQWEALSDSEKDESAYRMAVYAAQIYCADYNIGRFVKSLKSNKKYDNTLFIFMSDNGACAEPYKELGGGKFEDINNPMSAGSVSYGLAWTQVSNTPFKRYKRRLYEGGISTPLIVSWRDGFGKMKGAIDHTASYIPDIMATIVDITGAKYPTTFHEGNQQIHPMQGKSLAPVIKGEAEGLHEYLYWEHIDCRAIRKGNFKAVSDYRTPNKWELYNIATDRAELNDISAQHSEMLNELKTEWLRWANEVGVYPKGESQKKKKK